MAHHIQDHSPKKKKKKLPKKTAFLRCFGLSGRRDIDNLSSGDKPKPPPSAAAGGGGKRRRWLSLSLCRKQKSAAKTVPIADATAAPVAADDEVNRSKEIHVFKSDSSKKTSSKNRQLPTAPAPAAGGSPPPVPGETIHHKTSKSSRYEKTESTIIEKTKTSDHSNSGEHLTNHKKSSKKNISAGAGATDDKAVLSRASSPGKSQIKKKKPAAAAHGGVHSESNIDSTRNQDFTYGMSMLMVILIIMLLWGRLCAIVCTAAWFYFVPRIKRNQEPPETSRRSDGGISNDVVHFSSAERKKKVVLDGFLERNHRTTIVL